MFLEADWIVVFTTSERYYFIDITMEFFLALPMEFIIALRNE